MLDEAGGSIAFRFDARDAHLVLSPGAHEPIPFRVLVDGEPPGPSHGVDVDEDGNGVLGDGRMYQLVREHDKVRERTLEIASCWPAPSFTFVRKRKVWGCGDERVEVPLMGDEVVVVGRVDAVCWIFIGSS